MPLYLIERENAQKMGLTDLGAASLEREQSDDSLHWLFSFLSADQRTTFCLFQAPSAAYIHALSAAAGLPPAVVVEIEPVNREALERAASSG